MCVPCKVDGEGTVLKTQTDARRGDSFRLCWWRFSGTWVGSLFYNRSSSLWSLLSHYPVDVFYLSVRHCHGRRLGSNTGRQSLGQRGRWCLLLCCPRRRGKVPSVCTAKTALALPILPQFSFFCHGGAAQASFGHPLAFHSSCYCPLFIRLLSNESGAAYVEAEERRWSSQSLF